ncbi:MAG: sugar ABC transporter permease [Candidatus Dormiibacter spiritus]|nr:MAG: sugar ABC transporter permease [Candidatus Dormibacteraeota bacterium]
MAASAPAPAGSRRPRLQTLLGDQPIGYLFVAPFVIFLVAIYAYPFFYSIYMSFYDYFFAAPGAIVDRPFVGLANYSRALQDPLFHVALRNVVIFLLINVPVTVVVAMVLATALNAAIPLRSFFRAAYYVPYVTASVAAVSIWLWLFGGPGLVNKVVGPLAPNPTWLVNAFWVMPIIALYVTWKGLGLYILLYLAALQNIAKELYEAASVDGAGRIRSFFVVTVPGLRPATLLVVITSVITGANLFTEPYLLTGGGGPDNQSVSPVFLLYRQGIEQNHPGYAAAMGLLLVVGVLIVSAINRFVLERE